MWTCVRPCMCGHGHGREYRHVCRHICSPYLALLEARLYKKIDPYSEDYSPSYLGSTDLFWEVPIYFGRYRFILGGSDLFRETPIYFGRYRSILGSADLFWEALIPTGSSRAPIPGHGSMVQQVHSTKMRRTSQLLANLMEFGGLRPIINLQPAKA